MSSRPTSTTSPTCHFRRWPHKMRSLVRPELPTASVGSSQAPTPAVDNSAPFATRPQSTYESGNAVQTSGATSLSAAQFVNFGAVRTRHDNKIVTRKERVDLRGDRSRHVDQRLEGLTHKPVLGVEERKAVPRGEDGKADRDACDGKKQRLQHDVNSTAGRTWWRIRDLTFELSGRRRLAAQGNMMNRPERPAVGGPLERRVRPHFVPLRAVLQERSR
jgi:hypothetical protein